MGGGARRTEPAACRRPCPDHTLYFVRNRRYRDQAEAITLPRRAWRSPAANRLRLPAGAARACRRQAAPPGAVYAGVRRAALVAAEHALVPISPTGRARPTRRGAEMGETRTAAPIASSGRPLCGPDGIRSWGQGGGWRPPEPRVRRSHKSGVSGRAWRTADIRIRVYVCHT